MAFCLAPSPIGCGRDVARLSHPVEASDHGLRSGRIKRMVINHFSFLSPTLTPPVARPQPKALWPSKAIPSVCCPKTSWLTTNSTFLGILSFRTRCAGKYCLLRSVYRQQAFSPGKAYCTVARHGFILPCIGLRSVVPGAGKPSGALRTQEPRALPDRIVQ